MGFSSDWKTDDGWNERLPVAGKPLGREIGQIFFARKGPQKIF
jgi:hypothetical protein